MRHQTWNQQGQKVLDTELTRDVLGKVIFKDRLASTERAATSEEEAALRSSETNTKRQAARGKAIAAILANKTGAPWGVILYDMAVAQGLVEPT